ncbi:putative DNA-binding domain-containing protein [Thiocystis violacea]|uniref:HvfC family RiPP maturation protein n=1 Tax=Thiocystis violacea TaxID=13725 RepID=UPI00190314AD|nr:DUF2063 domain-containing protein [Thiocystis violacea]
MLEPADFIRRQLAFAAHLRDPETAPAPADVEERRLAIYRDLVFNNLSSLLAGSFPVLHRILPEAHWRELIWDFLRRHRARSPLFPELPEEFLDFLGSVRRDDPRDPPFLLELAHYEWVELALRNSEASADPETIDPDGDPLLGHPAVSPLAWNLTYRFPVHRLGPDVQPESPPPEPTHLVVYRTPDERIAFLEINGVTQRLLILLGEEPALTGRAVLNRIAAELGHPDPEQVILFGSALMADLRACGVLLGTETVPVLPGADETPVTNIGHRRAG